jgi:two-component system sensor histidine kinase KdpD
MQNFFKGSNLGVLREVTLRRTADRTHAHMEHSRDGAGGEQRIWRISETLLVCVGPSPTSAKVIRTSKRMAAIANARWIAAGVETTRRPLSDAQRAGLLENIRLAERLGAETFTLVGDNVADEIVSYAQAESVTRIVIGKSGQPRWRSLIAPNTVDQLLRASGDIDIYVIQGMSEGERPAPPKKKREPFTGYLAALGLVAIAGVIAWLMQVAGLSEANKAIVFLPAVVLAAMWWQLGPGVLAAIASVLVFDFFFVPPRYTFAVQDIQYLVTLGIMAAVALLVGSLAARLKRQVLTSRGRETRLEVLYRLSRALSAASGAHQLALAAQREVAGIFGGAVDIYLPHGSLLEPVVSAEPVHPHSPNELAVATWAFEHGRLAGKGTDTLPNSRAVYVPLMTSEAATGVLAVESDQFESGISPENRQLLETVASQIAFAIERDQLAEERRSAVLDAQTERMRSSLLSSVSHDLRTPLAVIAGTSSTLLEMGGGADDATRESLLKEVYQESHRLARLVENLLAMTRFESAVAVDKDWFPLEDVVGSALGRLREEIAGRTVNKSIPDDLPAVALDGVMIEQALFNIVENALKYSPPESPIDISARVVGGEMVVEVADRGFGLEPGELDQVFDKLYRGAVGKSAGRGAGLGLAIAKAVVEAHGGRIWASPRAGGGSVFAFSLPLESELPEPDYESELENQSEEPS